MSREWGHEFAARVKDHFVLKGPRLPMPIVASNIDAPGTGLDVQLSPSNVKQREVVTGDQIMVPDQGTATSPEPNDATPTIDRDWEEPDLPEFELADVNLSLLGAVKGTSGVNIATVVKGRYEEDPFF